jgi:hypothetical protein
VTRCLTLACSGRRFAPPLMPVVGQQSEGEDNEVPAKPKKRGLGLEMRTFAGKDGNSYLVFRTQSGFIPSSK